MRRNVWKKLTQDTRPDSGFNRTSNHNTSVPTSDRFEAQMALKGKTRSGMVIKGIKEGKLFTGSLRQL